MVDRGLAIADMFLTPGRDFETLAPNHPDAGERRQSRQVFQRALDFTVQSGAKHMSALPGAPPVRLEDIRLTKPISGDESPCTESCGRIGSLLHSADGRFVYVGDAGDVIDTRTREVIANLEALHNSRVQLEVDWVNGRAVFPRPS